MPQSERPEEIAARELVNSVLGVTLRFSDSNGGIDYRFVRDDVLGAMEVTRLTAQMVKSSKHAWANGNSRWQAPQLGHTWLVTTDGHPMYRDVRTLLEPALETLERHDLQSYDEGQRWWMRTTASLADAVVHLDEARVMRASHFSTSAEISQVILAPTGAGSSDGPDGALEEIEHFVATHPDNLEKLRGSGATDRHLFVWTDIDTPFRARRPLRSRDMDPPARPPSLPSEVTDIWFVDEPAMLGWYWSSNAGWRWVP